jgi:hypothetical protein
MTDGHGGMIEAHREYRIVRDAEFNLNLPGNAPAVEPAVEPVPSATPRVTEADAKAGLAEAAKRADEALRNLQIDPAAPSAIAIPSPAVDPLVQFGRTNQ